MFIRSCLDLQSLKSHSLLATYFFVCGVTLQSEQRCMDPEQKPFGDGSINYHPGTLTEPKCKQELQSDLGIPGGGKGFSFEYMWKKSSDLRYW